jgi:hypothetical protein
MQSQTTIDNSIEILLICNAMVMTLGDQTLSDLTKLFNNYFFTETNRLVLSTSLERSALFGLNLN